jgi:biopolymer transport protein ExbB
LQNYGFSSFVQQLDAVGMSVALLLVAMSVVTWYLIAMKALRVAQIRRRGDSIVARFWDAPSLGEAVDRLLDRHGGTAARPSGSATARRSTIS